MSEKEELEETKNQTEELDQTALEDQRKEVSEESETAEQTESENWQKKYEELNDKHLRLYAEFENFRRRNARERMELIQNAGEEIITQLIGIIDDFERAIKANEESTDSTAVKEGMDLIYSKTMNLLKQKGLKSMDSMNQEFDADLHEAVARIPAPKKKLKGKIVDVIEKGYYLNDKIIRHAKVVVGE
ncbi:MAG TPA: nucleotide exchange factor GrpE [Flavobacteriales bacterium]|jgi:molecular chaperone GrpE|nr:nucleotide exchange factor GrpE [Flavobacteriales bacterium]